MENKVYLCYLNHRFFKKNKRIVVKLVSEKIAFHPPVSPQFLAKNKTVFIILFT